MIIAKNNNFLALVAPTPLTTPEGRHLGELRRNARLGTQGTQIEGDKKSSQTRNEKNLEKKSSKKDITKITQMHGGRAFWFKLLTSLGGEGVSIWPLMI